MSGPIPIHDVLGAIEAAEDIMSRALRTEGSAVVLLSRDGAVAELMTARGTGKDIGGDLLRVSADIVDRLRRAGEPIRMDPTGLPPGRWRAGSDRPLASLGAMPILGETGVVGFMAFPSDSPIRDGHSTDPSWRMPCRVLKCAQLIAADDALRVALTMERRSRAELVDGVLVLDVQERVLVADGLFASLPAWGDVDPAGCPLKDLPGGELVSTLPLSTPEEPAWVEESLDQLGIVGKASLASLPRTARPGGRIVLLRHPVGHAGEGDGASRLVAFTLRTSQMADEIAHSLGLVRASGMQGMATALVEPIEQAVGAATRTVELALGRSLPSTSNGGLDLNAMVEQVLAACREELEAEGVRAIAITGGDLPSVPGDRLGVLGVLRTLVHTSRDSLRPHGGTLTLRTAVEDEWVHIAVADNGRAGARDGRHDERVFVTGGDLFDSTLDSMRVKIEGMGGRLTLDRRPGLWNRATILLPRERRRARRGVVEPVRTEEDAYGLRVLVVDDNAALRSVLRRYLERRGHSVTEACDGEEGLRVAQGREFDRLVVDIQMPHKDGLELFEGLATVQPSLQARTIFVTGGFLSDATARSIEDAGRPSVRKPFDLEAMAVAVEDCA